MFDYCKELSNKLIIIQDKIKSINKEQWKTKIEDVYNQYNIPLKKFYFLLSEIDVYCSGAKLSIQNGYHRPTIVDAEKSFVNCKEIRHPIVEKIHTETPYITNDIELGKVKNFNNKFLSLSQIKSCLNRLINEKN